MKTEKNSSEPLLFEAVFLKQENFVAEYPNCCEKSLETKLDQ